MLAAILISVLLSGGIGVFGGYQMGIHKAIEPIVVTNTIVYDIQNHTDVHASTSIDANMIQETKVYDKYVAFTNHITNHITNTFSSTNFITRTNITGGI